MYITRNLRTEAQLEKAVTDTLKAKGVLGYKFASPSKRGVPDRLYITQNGSVVFCEFKSPTGNGVLSDLQKQQIKKLKDNAADVWVVATESEGEKFIKYVLSLGFANA